MSLILRRLSPGRVGLSVLAVLFAACEDTKTVAPADPVALEVSPSGTVELQPGDTLRIRVSVANATDPSVRFRSSAPEVASVDAGGLVTARESGTATISIAPLADTTRQESLAVRVVAVQPAPGDGDASVRIAGVLDPVARQPLNATAIRGQALLRLDFERGPASRLQVLAGDSVVCAQSFTASASGSVGRPTYSAAAVPFECVLDTAGFYPETGAVAFRNGPLTVTARVLGPADTVRAVDQVTLGLANRDTLLATVAAPEHAPDAEGLVWMDGPVTVTALPVLYGSGSALARVTFTYRAPSGETLSATDASAPFSVAFADTLPLASGGFEGVTDPALRIAAASVLASGEPGPTASSSAIRYDNEAPVPGGLLGREWVGATTRFATLYDPRSQSDEGVGGISARFFAGSPSLAAARIVQSGTPVDVGGDLPEAGVGGYRFAARVCDALDNCQVLEGFTFGVDREAPVITGASLADRIVNPAQELTVAVSDDRSGFGMRYLQAGVTLVDADPATAACGPVVEEIDLPGRLVGGSCAPDTVGVLRVPHATAGYYTYLVAPLDQALNLGEAVSRTILVDRTAPSIESISPPAAPVVGSAATVSAVATDNLDLLTVSAALVYPSPGGSRLALPFAAADTAGTPFDAELATRSSASLSLPFVGSLTYPDAGRLATVRTFAADSIRVTATDVAGLSAHQGRPLSGAVPNANPFSAVDSVATSLNAQNVCTARCLGTDQTSTVLTARLVGPVGFRNPFEGGRIYFFWRAASGEVSLLGSAGGASVSDTGNRRVISTALTLRPPAGVVGDFALFAVGVNASGHGLLIGESSLRLFGR